MTPKHLERLAAIAPYVVPPPDSPAYEAHRARLDEAVPRKSIETWLQENWRRTTALLSAQATNGAGLSADVTLREFHGEYNSRLLQFGPVAMPSSFNGMEAFFRHIPSLVVFRLHPEIDHECSWTDFVDYVTSRPSLDEPGEDLLRIPEGVIYNYSNSEAPDILTLSGAGPAFGVSAVSLVRHGPELNVVLTCGRESDLAEETETIKRIAEAPTQTTKSYLEQVDTPPHAVALDDSETLWRHIAIARFDLEDRTQNARYLLKDHGASYFVLTDDPSVIGNIDLDSDGANVYVARWVEALKEYETLFELCALSLHLPSFFDANEDRVNVQRRGTSYRAALTNAADNVTRWIPGSERVAFRNVHVLPAAPLSGSAPQKTLRTPDFKIETSGFWRRLDPDDLGTDKHGNKIRGRTWVTKQLSWHEEDASAATVSTQPSPVPEGPDPGFLYLMRSAVHAPNVFKIGLTRRDSTAQRAAELTGSSSAPDAFHVLFDWPVGDCAKAEHAVHSALEFARVNPKREFFQHPIKDAVSIITEVLNV